MILRCFEYTVSSSKCFTVTKSSDVRTHCMPLGVSVIQQEL